MNVEDKEKIVLKWLKHLFYHPENLDSVLLNEPNFFDYLSCCYHQRSVVDALNNVRLLAPDYLPLTYFEHLDNYNLSTMFYDLFIEESTEFPLWVSQSDYPLVGLLRKEPQEKVHVAIEKILEKMEYNVFMSDFEFFKYYKVYPRSIKSYALSFKMSCDFHVDFTINPAFHDNMLSSDIYWATPYVVHYVRHLNDDDMLRLSPAISAYMNGLNVTLSDEECKFIYCYTYKNFFGDIVPYPDDTTDFQELLSTTSSECQLL